MKQPIEEGSYVRILSNPIGACWGTGYVADINKDGAVINFGTKGFPIYGAGIRRPMSELELV